MMAFERTPASNDLDPQTIADLRAALEKSANRGTHGDELRDVLCRAAAEARRKGIQAEQLLVVLKDIWYSMPQIAGASRGDGSQQAPARTREPLHSRVLLDLTGALADSARGQRQPRAVTRLPVEPVLPSLLDALASRAGVVLQAPPGAGKTTLVPQALLSAPWLGEQIVVMLEPRRVAARAAASRIAELLGDAVGGWSDTARAATAA